MEKKVFTDESLSAFVEEIKSYSDENLVKAKTYTDTVTNNKANSSHTHPISNITNLQSSLDTKVPTSRTVNGKSLTGNITLSASDVGAAASSHTHTVANISDLTATVKELNYMDGVTSNVQTQLDGKATSGHTHKYAGSSSIGGSATSAAKLDTNVAGSATQPVYFANGVPVATTYTLEKSVPNNAVFTDTHYSSKNIVGVTNAISNTSSALTNGNVYINNVENGAVTSSHKISGAGATTVTTDTVGNIIITSTDNNTTYSAAGSSLGLVKTGGDVTISNGTITINDDSHNHIVSNVDGLQTALDNKLSLSTGGTVNGNTVLRSSTSVSDGVMADATITSRSVVDGTSGLPTAIASIGVTNSSSVTNYGSATITANYLNEVVLNTSYLSDVSTIKLTPTKATIDTPFVSSYPSWQTIKVSHGTSGKESGFTAERTDTGTCVRFGVGAAGINHGVWSHTQNRWLIHGNANNIFIGENRAYGEKELYNNTTGTADTITLSDSAANYTYLEIHYKDNNGREFNSTKIYSPNGKSTDLFLVEAVASSTLIRRTRYNISGNKLTPDLTTAGYIQIYHNGTANKVGSETNYLRIVRVVGLV